MNVLIDWTKYPKIQGHLKPSFQQKANTIHHTPCVILLIISILSSILSSGVIILWSVRGAGEIISMVSLRVAPGPLPLPRIGWRVLGTPVRVGRPASVALGLVMTVAPPGVHGALQRLHSLKSPNQRVFSESYSNSLVYTKEANDLYLMTKRD